MIIFDLNTSKGYEMADFENLAAEYTKHFIDYYNKHSFSAFAAIVTYRDESIRRIGELEKEIDSDIVNAEKEIKDLRSPDEHQDFGFEVFFELKPYLENLKKYPNNRLREIFLEILEHKDYHKFKNFGLYKKINENKIDYVVEAILSRLYILSYDLRRAIIIKSAAAMLIREIIDLGAPHSFDSKRSQARIRALLPNKNVNKVTKTTIYEWYSEIKKVSKNKQEAFDKLKTEMAVQGLSVVDYIKTDDAENFDKAYREWLKRRRRK